MRKHILSVKIGQFGMSIYDTDIAFDVACYSDANESCRLMCNDGCESWSIKYVYNDQPFDHEDHPLRSTSCCAVEWFNAVDDGTESCYDAKDKGYLPLHDESEIEVEWRGDFWSWYILNDKQAKIIPFPAKNSAQDQRTAFWKSELGQHTTKALTPLIHKLNTLLAHRHKKRSKGATIITERDRNE